MLIFHDYKILKFTQDYPSEDSLIGFLENDGKNLEELYLDNSDCLLNLTAMLGFCPNLRKLHVEITFDDLEALDIIFNSCKYIESISVYRYCIDYQCEKEFFEALVTNTFMS